MIDWLWLRIRCAAASAHLRPGVITSITPDGEIEWQLAKWAQARGSFDATMAIRPRAGEFELSGSPAKFLQGHNAFGSDDIQGLALSVIDRVVDQLGVPLANDEITSIDAGEVDLLRTDVNYSYTTGSRASCLAWIRAAEQYGYLQHRGRGNMHQNSTVVWGAKSRHWQLKAYAKGQEIEAKKHKLPAELSHRELLTAWCDDKLRIEAQFNARYLKEQRLHVLRNWQMDTPALLHSVHLAKLNLSGEMKLQAEEIESLPRAIRNTHDLWAAGVDVRDRMSRNTFYTHRRALLEHGIDIAVAVPNAQRNVVPLIRYIEAKPASVPEFAVGTALYFEPRRTA